MPILSQPKFNWETPCRQAEFLRWEETAHINFEGNGNNGTKRQVAFMLDWVGQEGSRILELHNWSIEDKQNKKIIDALKANCQPEENAHLYKQQFFLIRQGSQETFSDLYQEVYHIYDLFKLEEEGRYSDHKIVQPARNKPEILG